MLARMALAIMAVTLCSSATAQSPTKVFRVGLLHVGRPGTCILAPGFTDAFARRGYIEGKNVMFERFAAGGRLERLPDAVDRMISDKVDLGRLRVSRRAHHHAARTQHTGSGNERRRPRRDWNG